ncbi:MAG TPA: hypothetical protein VFT71_04110 [Candidatus Nitrosocosmicus sp.]|nr:hypothetical protein [Candidatus Nitrosocosmicus sp.]
MFTRETILISQREMVKQLKTSKLKETSLPNKKLPIFSDKDPCSFHGYAIENLMKETSELRKIITKRGTLEILIPLCCSTDPVRYLTFRKSMKDLAAKH